MNSPNKSATISVADFLFLPFFQTPLIPNSRFWGEYEKSAIWFKNGDGNWTTSCRRYFNMS